MTIPIMIFTKTVITLIYEEESKSNLNMAIKSQNHVVDGCTTDMLCLPA
jgi:hypothetical protein